MRREQELVRPSLVETERAKTPMPARHAGTKARFKNQSLDRRDSKLDDSRSFNPSYNQTKQLATRLSNDDRGLVQKSPKQPYFFGENDHSNAICVPTSAYLSSRPWENTQARSIHLYQHCPVIAMAILSLLMDRLLCLICIGARPLTS